MLTMKNFGLVLALSAMYAKAVECDEATCTEHETKIIALETNVVTAQSAADAAHTVADGKCDEGVCYTLTADAATAKTTADTAYNVAVEAKDIAVTANTTATIAQGEVNDLEPVVAGKCEESRCQILAADASTAQTTAEGAQTTATTAQGVALTAQATAAAAQAAVAGKCDGITCTANAAAAAAAQTAADGAQTTADTAQSTANTAQTTANTAQTTANTAQTTADGAQTAADTAQTCCDTATTDIDTLQTDVGTVQTAADTAQTTADGAQTAAGTAQTCCDTATTDIGTLQTDVGTVQTAAETAQTCCDTATTDIGTLQTDVGTAQTAAETAQTCCDTATTDIGALQTDVTEHETQIDINTDNIAGIQSNVTTLGQGLLSHEHGDAFSRLYISEEVISKYKDFLAVCNHYLDNSDKISYEFGTGAYNGSSYRTVEIVSNHKLESFSQYLREDTLGLGIPSIPNNTYVGYETQDPDLFCNVIFNKVKVPLVIWIDNEYQSCGSMLFDNETNECIAHTRWTSPPYTCETVEGCNNMYKEYDSYYQVSCEVFANCFDKEGIIYNKYCGHYDECFKQSNEVDPRITSVVAANICEGPIEPCNGAPGCYCGGGSPSPSGKVKIEEQDTSKLEADALAADYSEEYASQLTNYGQLAALNSNVLEKEHITFEKLLGDITNFVQGKAYSVGVPYDDALKFNHLPQVSAFELGLGVPFALRVTKSLSFSDGYREDCGGNYLTLNPQMIRVYASKYHLDDKVISKLTNIDHLRAKVFFGDEGIIGAQVRKFDSFEEIACARANDDDFIYATTHDVGQKSACSSEFTSEQIAQFEARDAKLCYGELAPGQFEIYL